MSTMLANETSLEWAEDRSTSAQMGSSERAVSTVRLIVSFGLAAAFLAFAMSVSSVMGAPNYLRAVLTGQAALSLPFLSSGSLSMADVYGLYHVASLLYLAPLAFLPLMGWAAATHAMGIATGDRSVMNRRASRYPARVLALILLVAGDAWMAYIGIFLAGVEAEAYGNVPVDAIVLAVMAVVQSVISVWAYCWVLKRFRKTGLALDENPLLDTLLLSTGIFGQSVVEFVFLLPLALLFLLFVLRSSRRTVVVRR